MSEENRAGSYNYAAFEGKEDFQAFRAIAQVGTEAPDFTVVDVATGECSAISTRWRGRDLVIEFGSLT